jgi:hypothetical protein
MRFEYDEETNALYIYLRGKIPAGGVARTVELAPGVYLDADGAAAFSAWSSWTLRTSGGSWSETAGVLTSPRTSQTWRRPNRSRPRFLPSPGRYPNRDPGLFGGKFGPDPHRTPPV